MDPITIAIGSFTAIKTAVKAGKDIHALGKDLGKMWSAIDDAKNTHEAAARGKGTAQEKALTTYINAVRARDMEAELRKLIIDTRGFKGWNELQAIRQSVMKDEREGRYKALQKRNKLLNFAGVLVAVLITGIGAYLMLQFAIKYK